MNKPKLNKAVSDSISTIAQEGISVNIRLETITFVKLIFLALLIAGITVGANYGLHIIKK